MIACAAGSVEREVLRAKDLLERNEFQNSLQVAEVVITRVPENKDALYLAAVSLRYLNRLDDAAVLLGRLEAAHTHYGRAHQEKGHLHRALRNFAVAASAYERAVELNPALLASWTALVPLYEAAGRPKDAERAKTQVEHFTRLPRVLVSVASMIYEGDIHRADTLCRHFLRTQGHHLEAMRLLAEIGVRLDVLDDAEFLLESVVEFAPQHHDARYDYACVLSKRQKYAKARVQAEILLTASPNSRAYQGLHAAQCGGVGDHETAARTYQALLDEVPADSITCLSLGHANRTLGLHAQAVDAYRKAFTYTPTFGDAYWSLANLKTYRFTDGELSQMRDQLSNPSIETVDRYHLCFALGKALEDRQEYVASFYHYARGNDLKKQELRYRADLMERDLRLQAAVCSAEFLEARSAAGCEASDPIFIVGLPRAGSTLLEQILASHSKVEGTMELPHIRAIANRLDGRRRAEESPRYPAAIAGLTNAQLYDAGAKYIRDTKIYRSAAPMFIDKMPNNFRHIGLIHSILPNAKIIDARRNPMDCCFSCFKQLFATGQEFSYGLDDLGRYYRNYIELMDHWHKVLPGRILHVQYEDIVNDLEGGVRRVLDFCGLSFEPACLQFYDTNRSVRTASSEQVRRPIYRNAVGHWRKYARDLEPLTMALGFPAASASHSPL